MTLPQSQISFNARPLTDPVDIAAVRAFDRELKAQNASGVILTRILVIVGLIVGGLVMIPAVIALAGSVAASTGSPLLAALPVLITAAVTAGMAWIVVFSQRLAKIHRYRLHTFARANGMTYLAGLDDPKFPGMIFDEGHSRQSTDLLRGSQPRFVEFGNFRYKTGSGKNESTHTWGYVAVKLDVPLPNIVLDATGNNTLGSNLPESFDKNQRLSLEGDFDKHFRLYCPQGYERDALYLFTPDIMARFIDHAAELDVEIVDNWLFLYTRRQVSTLDPATWAWLFGVVGALMSKFAQWERWRDERLLIENPDAAASAAQTPTHTQLAFAPPVGLLTPPAGVAAQGRRLKRSTTWIPIVLVVAIGAFWLLSSLFGAR